MSQLYYGLDGHRVVPCSLLEMARLYESKDARRVGLDTVGEARVSTVFLAIDHNFSGRGGPILFETMVFGGPYDERQWHYRTWDEAEAGHRRIVADLQAGSEPGGRP